MEKLAKDPLVPSPEPDTAVVHGATVREVLGASSLAGSVLRAGASGLGRVVQRLNVMEVPDILPWVKPHELLLTTGYPLRHAPETLADLVCELDQRGLAAMAIKLHRYLDELPQAMLDEADRRGFPVIEIPAGVGFDDILLAGSLEPALTVVAQDALGLGRAAAELLFSRLDGFNGRARQVVLPARVIERGSGELQASS